MYIVYETNNEIETLRSKYLVLELDTIEFSDGKTVKAYAVIDSEHVVFQELTIADKLLELHDSLIKNYRSQDWDFCLEAISQLRGSFKGEVDTFYDALQERIELLKTANIADDWTGNILTEQTTESE